MINRLPGLTDGELDMYIRVVRERREVRRGHPALTAAYTEILSRAEDELRSRISSRSDAFAKTVSYLTCSKE